MSDPLDFSGRWRLRNGWEAKVSCWIESRWVGQILIGATKVSTAWDVNGDCPDNKDLDLMESLDQRAARI